MSAASGSGPNLFPYKTTYSDHGKARSEVRANPITGRLPVGPGGGAQGKMNPSPDEIVLTKRPGSVVQTPEMLLKQVRCKLS